MSTGSREVPVQDIGTAAGEAPKDTRPTLAEAGIDKKLSSRALLAL